MRNLNKNTRIFILSVNIKFYEYYDVDNYFCNFYKIKHPNYFIKKVPYDSDTHKKISNRFGNFNEKNKDFFYVGFGLDFKNNEINSTNKQLARIIKQILKYEYNKRYKTQYTEKIIQNYEEISKIN